MIGDYKKSKYLSEKIVKQKEIKEEKETKKNEIIIQKSSFIFPQKKPAIYKASTEEVEKSSVLNQKDFTRAKETIKFIKDKKWNSALKSASKVKDREFRNLITWMHLKTTRNGASFDEYKKFVSKTQKDKDKNTVILYSNDPEKQDSFIEDAKKRNYDIVLFDNVIDSHYINHVEQKLDKEIIGKGPIA